MWARVVEAMLAFWLLASPFVFGHPDGRTDLWATDLGAGALVLLLSLASYWRPTRRAHLAELAVAAWLAGFGWWGTRGGELPAYQNQIVLGILLAMVAIVPSEATLPPPPWRGAGGDGGARRG